MEPSDPQTPTEPQANPGDVANSTTSSSSLSAASPAADPGAAPAVSPTPTPTPTPVPTSPPVVAPVSPTGKSKKPLLIGIIVAAVLALGGGGTALAMWYQNPDKVVLDGIINTMQADKGGFTGRVAVTSKDVDVTVDITGKSKTDSGTLKADVKLKLKSGEFANQEFKITTDAVVVKENDVYFKVSNLEKALDSFVTSYAESYASQYRKLGYTITEAQEAQLRTQMKSMFSGVVSKIDNQWIKASTDDLKDNKDDENTCVANVFTKLSKDKKLSREVLDVYKKNRFLTVKEKLGTKDGSYGYLLDLDKDAAKKFVDGVEGTQFGKELVKCDSDAFKDTDKSSNDAEDTLKNGRFELWVSQWSHRITRMVASGESPDSVTNKMKLSADFKYDYNVKVDDIKAPEGAKSIKDIEADIKALTGSTGMLSSET